MKHFYLKTDMLYYIEASIFSLRSTGTMNTDFLPL